MPWERAVSSRKPAITAEERERLRREARELSRARCAAAAAAKTVEARKWLADAGLLVAGEGVGTGLVRMDRWRRARGYGVGGVQTSAPAYRPTVRQQQAAPLPGIVEVEF
jgi:hypothetical protein